MKLKRQNAVQARRPGLPMKRPSATKTRHILVETFLNRSVKMLERVSSAASPEALKAALSSPTDVGGVAVLLSDLAPLGLDLTSMDPFAEALARGAAMKRELLERAGGGLTSGQVARALGITRQAVDKRRRRRKLLAVPSGSGEYLYPACQFTPQGVILGLEEVLNAFQMQNPWTHLSALLARTPALKGKNVLETLEAGKVKKAVDVVASLGDQAA